MFLLLLLASFALGGALRLQLSRRPLLLRIQSISYLLVFLVTAATAWVVLDPSQNMVATWGFLLLLLVLSLLAHRRWLISLPPSLPLTTLINHCAARVLLTPAHHTQTVVFHEGIHRESIRIRRLSRRHAILTFSGAPACGKVALFLRLLRKQFTSIVPPITIHV